MPLTTADVLDNAGYVTIADKEFRLAKLSVEREGELWRAIEAECKKARGPGGLFQLMAPTFKWMRENGQINEWKEACETVTRLEAGKAPPTVHEVEDYRRTPAGVALEFWHRIRESHPGTTVRELATMITDANASTVFNDMAKVLRGDDPKTTPSPSTG